MDSSVLLRDVPVSAYWWGEGLFTSTVRIHV